MAGGCGQGIFRPGMLWVSSSHVLAHLGISICPKALKVPRHRKRSSSRGKEVDQHWMALRANGWGFGPAEQGLELGREHRARVDGVIEPGVLAGGEFEAWWKPLLQLLLFRVVQSCLQGVEPVDPGQVLPSALSGKKGAQPGVQFVQQGSVIEGGPVVGIQCMG